MENARKLIKKINQFQKSKSDNSFGAIEIKLSNKYFLCIGYVTYINIVNINYIDEYRITDRIDNVTKFIQRKPELFNNIIFRIEEEVLKSL